MYLAAQNGHAAALLHLLAVGADPHHAITGGASPLLSAAKNRHVEIVRILIDHGVDPDVARDPATVAFSWRASQIAAHGNDLAVLRTLMCTGSNLRDASAEVPRTAADVLHDVHDTVSVFSFFISSCAIM